MLDKDDSFRSTKADQSRIEFWKKKPTFAIIYVTFYTSSKLANDNEQRMTGKMATNDKIFSDGITFNLNEYHIFQCKGMGQTHFVFSNKSQLFWISVDSSIAKPFLEAVLTQLKQESIK